MPVEPRHVRPGDTVAFRHASRPAPIEGRVLAIGKDGITVTDPRGKVRRAHRVAWDALHAHAPAVVHDSAREIEGLTADNAHEQPELLGKAKTQVSPASSILGHSGPPDGHAEQMPERYLRELAEAMADQMAEVSKDVLGMVLTWLEHRLENGMEKAKSPRLRPNPTLTAQDLDELANLIRAAFGIRVGAPLQGTGEDPPHTAMPQDWMRRRWLAWRLSPSGLRLGRGVDLQRFAGEALVLGRLHQVLNDSQGLQDARQMAAELPLPRETSLMMQAAQEHAGQFITGWADQYVGCVRASVLKRNQQLVGSLVSRYLTGDLKAVDDTPDSLRWKDQARAEGERTVSGMKALAADLRTRWQAIGDNRDWERLACSEVRLASNTGTMHHLAEDGAKQGKTPEGIKVYFLVSPHACGRCKQAYLDRDGTPKTFTLQELMDAFQATGGISTAEYGGPNMLLHPYCSCRLMRMTSLGPVVKEAAPFEVQKKRIVVKKSRV